uniref:Uncharacterized protein n=1 Tax=Arundo donax TaxID=35708 RepID=A0A0A9HGP1_ARUDO
MAASQQPMPEHSSTRSSACKSGTFLGPITSADQVVTASSANRPSPSDAAPLLPHPTEIEAAARIAFANPPPPPPLD